MLGKTWEPTSVPGAVRPASKTSGSALPQDISDCYLELFPSHLYFQAHGSEGLTFQVSGTDRGREGLRSLGVPAAPPILSCGRGCYH